MYEIGEAVRPLLVCLKQNKQILSLIQVIHKRMPEERIKERDHETRIIQIFISGAGSC